MEGNFHRMLLNLLSQGRSKLVQPAVHKLTQLVQDRCLKLLNKHSYLTLSRSLISSRLYNLYLCKKKNPIETLEKKDSFSWGEIWLN